MRVQLWSYNYDPEPSGIAPLSTVWAQAMTRRGHEVSVVAAHPHYPKPLWGRRVLPYREERAGIDVLRLPLMVGRGTSAQRMRQELSFVASLSGATPTLPTADVIVAVSPSFPALLPTMINCRVRRVPWVLWLQDILPDGAVTTGLVREGRLLQASRRLERAAYGSARQIVVISEAFRQNLAAKGVPARKMNRIYNPSAVDISSHREPAFDRRRILVMGNVGHTQGLAQFVRAVEESNVLERLGAELRIAGEGVAADDVRAEIRGERVRMLGLLLGEEIEQELAQTSIGVVTQRADVSEFNLPSKLMNYMAHGLPVLAVVRPDSETARIVVESGAGVVADAGRPDELAGVLERMLDGHNELRTAAAAAHSYASAHFAPDRVAERWEAILRRAVQRR